MTKQAREASGGLPITPKGMPQPESRGSWSRSRPTAVSLQHMLTQKPHPFCPSASTEEAHSPAAFHLIPARPTLPGEKWRT